MGSRTLESDTTVYVQSDQQTIADYTDGAAPASSTYRYVYASYIGEPVMRFQTSGSTRVYYHRNQQYSITALTNSSGAVLERYAYTAYGVPTITNAAGTVLTSSAHNNRYTYTSREWDNDLNQYHYRARMYDASLGRFCSRDPIGYEGSDWGLYEFVHAKSLIALDPTGLIDQIHPSITTTCGPPICTYVTSQYSFGAVTVNCANSSTLSGQFGFSVSVNGGVKGQKLNFGLNIGWDVKVTLSATCSGPPGVGNGYKICDFIVPVEYDACVSNCTTIIRNNGPSGPAVIRNSHARLYTKNLKVGILTAQTIEEVTCCKPY